MRRKRTPRFVTPIRRRHFTLNLDRTSTTAANTPTVYEISTAIVEVNTILQQNFA
jgi:hypothetical protein